MSRNVLVIGGLSVVVLGLLVGLWLMLMKNDEASARGTQVAAGSSVAHGPPANPPHGGTTTTPGTVAPPPVVPPPGSGDNPREYEVGGMTVRDHRSGEHKPLEQPPNVHAPDDRRIQSSTTHAISLKVQGALKQCVANVPRDARGDKPRLEGQLLIAIKDQRISVTSATAQVRNMSEAATPALKQCIEQQAVGLGASAAGEPDVENYSINISFAIP